MAVKKRYFVPEVMQTSEMDCGPASLCALLEGFGISASYGRLREACQTAVDGTSIDTIEQVAGQLGLDAEQIMLPSDHLLLPEASALPALVVVRLPSGMAHFIIIWSVHGRFVQVMDPGSGRRWVDAKELLSELFIHHFGVPSEAFLSWARTDNFLDPLRRRLGDLEVSESGSSGLIDSAVADPDWRALAALDAATRMVTSIVKAGGLERGAEAERVLARFFEEARHGSMPDESPIPAAFWFADPMPPEPPETDRVVFLRGAVLVHVLGARDTAGDARLPPELEAALQESPAQPEKDLWRVLRQDGLLLPTLVIIASSLATVSAMIEALLLQSVMRLASAAGQVESRTFVIGALSTFMLLLLALDLPLTTVRQRLGRRLETRLRILLLEKIPRLSDRYFHSRLTSDMTMRAHGLRMLRGLPDIALGALQTTLRLVLTVTGVIVLDPVSAPRAIAFTVAFLAFTLLTGVAMNEREMRVNAHSGALSRFYLDALVGLVPVRMHGAERSLRREHESLLTEWARSSLDTWNISVLIQSVGSVLYAVFSVLTIWGFVSRGGQTGNMLLLFYWTLSLPAQAQALFDMFRRYPQLRNQTLRLLEPLGSPDDVPPDAPPAQPPPTPEPPPGQDSPPEPDAPASANPEDPYNDQRPLLLLAAANPGAPNEPDPAAPAPPGDPPTETSSEPPGEQTDGPARQGYRITLDAVTVQAGGRPILNDVTLHLAPGEHVAIVGPSGAGKSSLVGVLLGWHRPSAGECRVDELPLDGERLRTLRRETAWVDPSVQLWNRSLLANLRYGDEQNDPAVGAVLEGADLYGVLERLPEGMQTVLGESGGLVSGGEGQRVRLGRAMHRKSVRLAILDEPCRGLDRSTRHKLLDRARAHWRAATMICITHDVGETLSFERVLVIEDGRVVEDDSPEKLASQEGSRYRQMLDMEESVRHGLWASQGWRRWWLEDGKVKQTSE